MEQREYIARTSGLKFRDYAGYGLIDTAGCLIFSLVTTLLQKYYTDILHLSPLFIMLMFIGARIWDAINDPIMGRIADTARPSKYGRYRAWILYAAVPRARSSAFSASEDGIPVCANRRISRSTAAYFSSTAASRSSDTSPTRWPMAVRRSSALSCRSRRRYSLREVIMR